MGEEELMKVNRSSYKGVEELERPLSLCLSISLSQDARTSASQDGAAALVGSADTSGWNR